MGNPPDPHIPDIVLAALAKLQWIALRAKAADGTELGFFVNGKGERLALYLDKGELWSLYPATSAGLGPFAISEATTKAILAGRHTKLKATFEAPHLIAR